MDSSIRKMQFGIYKKKNFKESLYHRKKVVKKSIKKSNVRYFGYVDEEHARGK